MFSFKFSKDDSKSLKSKRIWYVALLAVVAVCCLVCKLNWSLVVLLAIVIYILKNFIYFIARI